MSLGQCYDKNRNGFDIARYIFALCVIYSHCYPLLGIESGDFLQRWSKNNLSLGSFAVDCFFIIGGFLIAQSILHSSSTIVYFKKRVIRIFPAFITSLILCAFFIGPSCSSLSMPEYLKDEGDGPFSFVIKNLTFNLRGYAWGIHDVFSENPFPFSINGSMWTLKHEFACYLVILVFYHLHFLTHKKLFFLSTIALLFLAHLNINSGFIPFSLRKISRFFLCMNEGEYASFIRLLALFIYGACIYLWMDRIPLYCEYIVICWILVIVGARSDWYNYAIFVCLPYAVLGTCITLKKIQVKKIGDLSYGMYIYAFPIQQTICFLTKGNINFATFFVLSLAITIVIAKISWETIEKGFLKYK